MKCPFTGKPCLLPKEVFVTEVSGNQLNNLFLCRQCGDNYIAQLDDPDVVTKSLEVISNAEGLSHQEHVLEDAIDINSLEQAEEQTVSNDLKKVSLIPQIKKIEAKMQEAIDRENYEDAALLRDILTELHEKRKREEEVEDDDEDDDDEDDDEEEE